MVIRFSIAGTHYASDLAVCENYDSNHYVTTWYFIVASNSVFFLCVGWVARERRQAVCAPGGDCTGLPALQEAGASWHQAGERPHLWQGVPEGETVRLWHDAMRWLSSEAGERNHPVHGSRTVRPKSARGPVCRLQHRRVGLRRASVLHAHWEFPLGKSTPVRRLLRGVCALAASAEANQCGAFPVAAFHWRRTLHVPLPAVHRAGPPMLCQRGL